MKNNGVACQYIFDKNRCRELSGNNFCPFMYGLNTGWGTAEEICKNYKSQIKLFKKVDTGFYEFHCITCSEEEWLCIKDALNTLDNGLGD